jgi:phosphate transport system substrate-binding protein
MIMGGVVAVVSLPGVGENQLKLSPDVLADIFLGRITKWSDSRIQSENAGLRLPEVDITVVHRSDGSGTNWIFTNYLSKVSPVFKEKVGNGKAVSWPVGVGGKGNPGVAEYVKRVKGSIGYVEYAYALQNKRGMSTVQLKNRAGKYLEPTSETFQAAAANAAWNRARDYYMVLTDQPGDKSWPIVGASFILMHKNQRDASKAAAVLKFLDWCYQHGAPAAQKLDYVPMPENVVQMVRKTWAERITASGQPVWRAD